MKPGIESAAGLITFVVTSDMTAQLDGREIHPVYGTFWAGYHSEVAARRAIEPYFEEGENAVGSALSINHKAMAAVGTSIEVIAQVTSISGNRIICSVQIRTCETNTLLAEGTQEQVVLLDAKLRELVARAYTR